MTDLTARALSLLDELVDLPAGERAHRLATLAQRDPGLHTAVVALLQAHARGESTAPDDDAGTDPRIGTRMGAWRVVRLIARGAMGSVYEAHRDDGQYRQRVALKCIRAELVSDASIAAFRDERNRLARLDHPGIASLIDGGVDDGGHPWLAMRFVDGVAIDRWCDQRRVTVHERIGLLIQASQALASAHAQGLLHRDIKPSNLLVTDEGRVQLIGFGLSSRFESMTGGRAVQTTSLSNYAAPETHTGGAAGPAADLYALGVLTYRLLSAQSPTAATPMDRLLGQAGESIAHERGLPSLAALTRLLAGDLSAIALKAVAVRPQDRYPSGHAFEQDLQRWLRHLPVDANPVGPWTKARKWLRRNRIAATLGAFIALSLFAGLGYSLWQHHRAVSQSRATHAIGELFASTLGTATLSGLGSAPYSSRALLAKTETQLRLLDLREQPAVLARGLAMLARSYAVIGDYRRAELLADQAQRTLGEETDEDGYIAATHVSMLNQHARYAEAARLAQERLAEIGTRHDPSAHRAKVTFGVELALAQWGLGDTAAALRSLDLAHQQALALGHDNQELLAQVLIQRSALRARMYRLDEAQADLEQAIGLADGRNTILADDAREQLLTMLVYYRRASDVALAERLLRDRRATLGDRHPKTGRAWILLSYAQYINRQEVVAQQAAEAGQKLIEAAYGRQHPEYAFSLLITSIVAARDSHDNVAAMREALRISEATLGPRHETTLNLRRLLAMRLRVLPPGVAKPNDHKEAEALFAQNMRIKREAGVPAPWEKLMLAHTLQLHGSLKDLPRIEALLRDSREDARRYFVPGDSYTSMAELFWAGLLYQQDHRDQADRAFARIIETQRNDTAYLAQMILHDAWLYRGLYAFERCDNALARSYLEQSLASESQRLGPDHFLARDTAAFLKNLRSRGVFLNPGAQVPMPARTALDAAQLRAQTCRRSLPRGS